MIKKLMSKGRERALELENASLRGALAKARRRQRDRELKRILVTAERDALLLIDLYHAGYYIGKKATASVMSKRRHEYASAVLLAAAVMREPTRHVTHRHMTSMTAEKAYESVRKVIDKALDGNLSEIRRHLPEGVLKTVSALYPPTGGSSGT
jgi:hypothetical protein